MKRKNMKEIFIVLLVLLSCGGIVPTDPTGFGVWSDDCSKIAVAVNKEDWDNGPFMDHGTNERTDLYICDTAGNKIKTLYTDKKADGNDSKIDSLYFNQKDSLVYVYTLMYGTGKIKKEKIYLTTETFETVEYLEISNWPSPSHFESSLCNNNKIVWNKETKWVEVKN